MKSGDVLAGIETGVGKTRSVRRRTEDKRWSRDAITGMVGVPEKS